MEVIDFSIKGNGWEASFDESVPASMKFSIRNERVLELRPVSFGTLDESSGIVAKCRMHSSVDNLSAGVGMKTVIPFGGEPVVERNIEFAANHAKIVTDIKTAGRMPAEKFSVDSLFIHGEWKQAAIIPIPSDSHFIPKIEWRELDGDSIYDSSEPFLVCLLKSEDGKTLEIGTGDDLWRWTPSDVSEGAVSNFKIEKQDNGILISRDILRWEAETEMPSRNWRFKWHFAWSIESNAPNTPQNDYEFDFLKSKIPVSTKVQFNGDSRKEICFAAHVTQKRMKKWIRAEASNREGEKISILNLEPHFCESAAHLERAKRETLRHWDIMKIFDFWLWANKQLNKKDNKLFIVPPENSVFRELPSSYGLRE